MSRPFGWLVVAEPSDHIDQEIAELRAQLNVLRRYDEEHARFDAGRAERRLAELDAFREAGLWNVRVMVGAATAEELRLIAPVLIGSVDLAAHPYRLRGAEVPRDLADALAARLSDPVDGPQVPFSTTAGTLAALSGLPRGEVPGVRVLKPGYFDVTSETSEIGEPAGITDTAGPGTEIAGAIGAGGGAAGRAKPALELGAILDGQDRKVGTFGVPLSTVNRHAFDHRRDRIRQVADGPAHAGAADQVRGAVAGDRAGQVRVRGDGRPHRRRRPGDGDQPVRPGRGPAVGEPAGARARLPGAGPHRHGAGAVPGRVRRQGAVPADHLAGAAAGLRGLRLGSGDRRRPAGRGGPARGPDAWPSCRTRRWR